MNVLANLRRQAVPLIMQSEKADCGLACLAMIAVFHGHRVDVAGLRSKFGNASRGMSVAALMDCGEQLLFKVAARRLTIHELKRSSCGPWIVHWQGDHFVVLERLGERFAVINDPAVGRQKLRVEEFEKRFGGIVLSAEPAENFEALDLRYQKSIFALLPNSKTVRLKLLQLLIATIGIEILALLLPLQVKLVIDAVVSQADQALLLRSSLFFGVVLVFLFVLTIVRSNFANHLGVSVASNWSLSVLSHMMRLPIEFVQGRSIGDMISRVSSIGSIQHSLTSQAIDAVLGCIAIVAIAFVLLSTSWVLTLIVGILLVMTLGIRILAYPITAKLNEAAVTMGAIRNGEVAETIRGIQAIQLSGTFRSRMKRLTTIHSNFSEAELRLQNYMAFYTSATQIALAGQRILLVAFGAKLVIDSSMSIGGLVAFMAYADMFMWRATGVLDRVTEIRLVRTHTKRVADLLCQDVAAPPIHPGAGNSGMGVALDACGLGYRFPYESTWVFRNFDLHLRPGEIVALIGPSGVGKSTFAKVMLGLLQPTEGSVRVDGVDLLDSVQDFRRRASAVLQEDALFSGSILENIAFGDETPDNAYVIEVAASVGIHRDIVDMPMGYGTIVGEAGLSSGQRQRILLARALYRRPSILILDEATSHLDLASEKVVADAIRRSGATALIIAHRPETIHIADRVVSMEPSRSNKSEREHDDVQYAM